MINRYYAMSVCLHMYGQNTQVRLYIHNISKVGTTFAQWCTSWCRQPRAYVQTLGTNPRGVMCLFDGGPVEVQAPCWVAHQLLVLGSSFVVVACLISSHLTMKQLLQIIVCDDNSLAIVSNEGSIESPRPPPSICMVDR